MDTTYGKIPRNGQGLVAFIALNILKGFDFAAKDTVETYHEQIEAAKLAFVHGLRYITDPRIMNVSVRKLLDNGYAEARRIGFEALTPETCSATKPLTASE
ncbi:hypothetical protein ET33_23050 [Paenibacillus tyrfis]|uniref:Uncharacterized protein n=1 Tax=Paenibacillus tyrfis TaxID=1501230 RepID=A0A081NVE7_9BACL|nr:hypothetical protein ET33_23050 [Paenibacillus tyrfis]